MNKQEFFNEVVSILKDKNISKDEAARLKLRLCKRYNIKEVPTDIQVLLNQDKNLKLVTKPVRTQSGVAVIALMTAPFACKHGKCIFCPGGPKSVFGDVPQSYTGREPSTMRSMRNDYDPYLITFNRLEQYVATGHSNDKIEMIIMGGTFPSFDSGYQEDFVTYALKGLNDFGDFFYEGELDFPKYKEFFEMPGNLKDPERVGRIKEKLKKLKGESSLEKEQLRNEKARIRCVALCIETKPDWCFENDINNMLKFGATRVELGVQCLNDEILKKTNRGHTLADSIKATQLMRDSFLKIGYHMMPGLPRSNKEMDVGMFKEIFSNPDYMPDSLKIYPTLVMQGTGLYELWKKGIYMPLSLEEASEIISEAKRFVPKWCRVMRIQRDIPTYSITKGVKNTNLRQYVEEMCIKKGIKCRCIRCKEPKDKRITFENVKMSSETYEASGSSEIFISVEDTKNDLLLGFVRLRIPSKPFRKEITENTAGIRELHVYGQAVPIGEKTDLGVQHKGFGRRLLEEAEKIAREKFDSKKMLVISGVGVRGYYRKFGYEKEGVYMGKRL